MRWWGDTGGGCNARRIFIGTMQTTKTVSLLQNSKKQ
jgi:hypothetical protein